MAVDGTCSHTASMDSLEVPGLVEWPFQSVSPPGAHSPPWARLSCTSGASLRLPECAVSRVSQAGKNQGQPGDRPDPALTVLQSVHESRGMTEGYLRLETLIPKVVSPFLGTYGLYSNEGPCTHACILGRRSRLPGPRAGVGGDPWGSGSCCPVVAACDIPSAQWMRATRGCAPPPWSGIPCPLADMTPTIRGVSL